MPKAARTQLLLRIRNSPGALAQAHGLLTTTRRGEPGLSIGQFGDMSIDHIIASTLSRVFVHGSKKSQFIQL